MVGHSDVVPRPALGPSYGYGKENGTVGTVDDGAMHLLSASVVAHGGVDYDIVGIDHSRIVGRWRHI